MNPYYLYAEDDPDDVFFLKKNLHETDSQKELVTVNNGYELLQYLQGVSEGASYPTVIILDINMPRLSGTETLELLKTDDFYRLIPVVMLSTNPAPSDEAICERLGVTILKKPVNLEQWKSVSAAIRSYSEEAG